MVYIQAKRYKENNDVGASLVRDFIWSLAIKGAKKRNIYYNIKIYIASNETR